MIALETKGGLQLCGWEKTPQGCEPPGLPMPTYGLVCLSHAGVSGGDAGLLV